MNQPSQNNCPHAHIESNMIPDTCRDCGAVIGIDIGFDSIPPTKGIITAENLEEHIRNFPTTSLREEFRMWIRNHERREDRLARGDEIEDFFISKIQDIRDSEVLRDEKHNFPHPEDPELRDNYFRMLGRNQLRAQIREMLTNLIK